MERLEKGMLYNVVMTVIPKCTQTLQLPTWVHLGRRNYLLEYLMGINNLSFNIFT